MNLHQIVRGPIAAVNPDITGQIIPSLGTYSVTTSGRQVPDYGPPVDAIMQVQPLSGRDLKQLEAQGVNVATIDYAVYVNGPVTGVDRVSGLGGDLLVFGGRTWLVTQGLEAWNLTAGWTKVGVTQQMDPGP